MIESAYPFSPSGVFTTVSYGIPYFERLPGGMTGPLLAAFMPGLSSEPRRYALEEAVPGPTDVSPANPEVTKLRFNVPVQIERNDMLVTLRSDHTEVLDDVLAWLAGESDTLAGEAVGESGLGELITVTSSRLMFNQIGLPRAVADAQGLPYAETINPKSSMWMSFSDQQVGNQRVPADHDLRRQQGREVHHRPTRFLLRPRLDPAPLAPDPRPGAVLRTAG